MHFQYTCEQAAVADFLKMFANAKIYNEEVSQVYKDAVALERIVKNKMRNYSHSGNADPLSPKPGRR